MSHLAAHDHVQEQDEEYFYPSPSRANHSLTTTSHNSPTLRIQFTHLFRVTTSSTSVIQPETSNVASETSSGPSASSISTSTAELRQERVRRELAREERARHCLREKKNMVSPTSRSPYPSIMPLESSPGVTRYGGRGIYSVSRSRSSYSLSATYSDPGEEEGKDKRGRRSTGVKALAVTRFGFRSRSRAPTPRTLSTPPPLPTSAPAPGPTLLPRSSTPSPRCETESAPIPLSIPTRDRACSKDPERITVMLGGRSVDVLLPPSPIGPPPLPPFPGIARHRDTSRGGSSRSRSRVHERTGRRAVSEGRGGMRNAWVAKENEEDEEDEKELYARAMGQGLDERGRVIVVEGGSYG